MNIKRHYTTVIILAIINALVIFGLKNILPRELYVGLSVLAAMLLVISYSVLDIIGFFINKEWVLEEKMWLFDIPIKKSPWTFFWVMPPFMVMAYLHSTEHGSFSLLGAGGVASEFSVSIYLLLTLVLSFVSFQLLGLYRFFSFISENKGKAVGEKIKNTVLAAELLERNWQPTAFYTSVTFFVIVINNLFKTLFDDFRPFFIPFGADNTPATTMPLWTFFCIFFFSFSFVMGPFFLFSFFCTSRLSIALEWLVTDNPPLYLRNRFANILKEASKPSYGYAFRALALFSYAIFFYFLYVSIV